MQAATKMAMDNRDQRCIPVKRAAEIIGVSVQSVRNYIEQGLLKAGRVGDRGWLTVNLASALDLRQRKNAQNAQDH
jgi:hypothetical protein